MKIHALGAQRARLISLALLAGMLTAGQSRMDHGEDMGDPTGDLVQVEYVCDNQFMITNSGRKAVTVTLQVAGAKEKAVARLPAAPPDDHEFSEVAYKARSKGALELFRDGKRVGARENGGYPCPATEPAVAAKTGAAAAGPVVLAAVDTGQWSPVFSWPNVAVHLHVLPNGRVLAWGNSGGPQVWDPATGVFTPFPAADRVFCAGHAFLADGRLLVAGGHISTGHGLPDVNTFTAAAGWVAQPSMPRGRWYPSVTTMANGEAVIIAGRDEAGLVVTVPEVFTRAGTLRALTGASRSFPYYPRAFLAPNGRLFYAGEQRTTRYLDIAGNGAWTTVGDRRFGPRPYGSAVMYDRGKILYSGGALTTNTAEIIDLTAATPRWQFTAPMAFARRHHNLTVLPNGEVLATAGVAGTTFNDLTKPVHAAEIRSPATGTWRTVASSVITRGYHASAVLLPDGRVLLSGSGDGVAGTPRERNAEIYSPPYLFAGARPTITQAPTTASYGGTISVVTPQAATIANVSLIRLGSVTHAFDNNQRFQRLAFTRTGGALTVTIPNDRNVIPPGHYMVFILNASGVPSVAKIVRIT